MKLKIFLFLLLATLALSCHKNDLPESVKLGKSKILLNGKRAKNYEPYFLYLKAYGVYNLGFTEQKNDIFNTVGISLINSKDPGSFMLDDEFAPIDGKVNASFEQIVDWDTIGNIYELTNPEDGYFIIDGIDTIDQEISGRFRASFHRKSNNGHTDEGLPDDLLFEGVFNEKYEVK
jgi:hypothetical protein